MKNILLVTYFLAVLFIPVIIFGQKTFVSIGPELALSGSNKQYNDRGTGFGGSFRLESSWSKHVSGMATIGYLSFAKKSPYSSSPTYTNQLNAFLIQIGVKYYIQEKNKTPDGFFFSGEIGIMPTSTHITYTNGSKQYRKESDLSSALGVGYQYKRLESSFRLQYNLGVAGFHVYYYNFRIAYSFLRRKK